MKAHYLMFAGYNRWANARLYDAAAALDDAQYRQDCGAFFGSVHRTLNHLLATDRIWLKRLSGIGEPPDRLDAVLHGDLASLRAAREAEDGRIAGFIASLDDATIATAVVHYRRVSTPEPIEQALAPALAHWFNHQTHHRGQVHAILTQLVGKAPELDLLFYQRLSATGSA